MTARFLLLSILAAVGSVAAPAETPKEPAKDLFMHFERVPGVEMRFVDYHWHPKLFEAMESGTGAEPLAKRNWVYARLILQTRTLKIDGKLVPVGNYGVALWPNLEGKGMAVEIREVDMRDVLPNLNAMAPLPEKGELIYKAPARIERVPETVQRLTVDIAEKDGSVVMTLRYGDRQIPLVFTP